ncbi:MAG: Gfo/Idh/MocA family oxidoreductase [Deltaproteobacteria bacterium]|nr:Gfo/Idh/MocA family oxidoreductase [Deltaproteobacteria bacterium]
MNKVRVAVIGVGYLGKFHAEKYHKMEDVELIAVVDTKIERAKEVAKKFNTQFYTDYTQILNVVDAVSVVVPTPLHYPITMDLFEHNIDVMVEKPMTTTLEQAKTLNRIAKEKKLIFQVGHLERFNGAIIALNDILKEPLFIESHRLSAFTPRCLDVDVVLDLMIHDIDIILSISRSKVKSIHAVGVPIITSYVDIANARIEFENGCVANITASRVSKETMRRIRIFQEDAYISIDYETQNIFVTKKVPNISIGPFPMIKSKKLEINKSDSLELELKSFINSVKTRRKPVVSGEEGEIALEVALEITNLINETIDKKKKKLGIDQLP